MTISNVFALSPSKPNKCPTNIRWPVEEMGKNSANPSTIPSIKAMNKIAHRFHSYKLMNIHPFKSRIVL